MDLVRLLLDGAAFVVWRTEDDWTVRSKCYEAHVSRLGATRQQCSDHSPGEIELCGEESPDSLSFDEGMECGGGAGGGTLREPLASQSKPRASLDPRRLQAAPRPIPQSAPGPQDGGGWAQPSPAGPRFPLWSVRQARETGCHRGPPPQPRAGSRRGGVPGARPGSALGSGPQPGPLELVGGGGGLQPSALRASLSGRTRHTGQLRTAGGRLVPRLLLGAWGGGGGAQAERTAAPRRSPQAAENRAAAWAPSRHVLRADPECARAQSPAGPRGPPAPRRQAPPPRDPAPAPVSRSPRGSRGAAKSRGASSRGDARSRCAPGGQARSRPDPAARPGPPAPAPAAPCGCGCGARDAARGPRSPGVEPARAPRTAARGRVRTCSEVYPKVKGANGKQSLQKLDLAVLPPPKPKPESSPRAAPGFARLGLGGRDTEAEKRAPWGLQFDDLDSSWLIRITEDTDWWGQGARRGAQLERASPPRTWEMHEAGTEALGSRRDQATLLLASTVQSVLH
ncbi:translation initiation factor IF-2-like [Canis lupus dingo]|uniref:translation initiation factor IF-2-like n=1 Tax=Canis lupus dingo TaxID=286419 RepID=UPI000DC668F0|nr:translation initiation factor IF-2-like [Canis lupus dingo]